MADIRTPHDIIDEQGQVLSEMTRGTNEFRWKNQESFEEILASTLSYDTCPTGN